MQLPLHMSKIPYMHGSSNVLFFDSGARGCLSAFLVQKAIFSGDAPVHMTVLAQYFHTHMHFFCLYDNDLSLLPCTITPFLNLLSSTLYKYEKRSIGSFCRIPVARHVQIFVALHSLNGYCALTLLHLEESVF